MDAVAEHPWLLEKAGVDPALIQALPHLRLPERSDRLALSFTLPKPPGDLRLQHITVEREGIRVEPAGPGIPLGGTD
ncbi:hypothetical protein [Streptomyces sp. NPDC088725]|uniref:hypothetical protein n=1 Tax=Streptomyces sp. NPDC088725 TaxID=3365873 RepID=UPI003806A4E5